MPKKNTPMKRIVCTICGRIFTVPNSSGAVRCTECRKKYRHNKDITLNRPFTKDTVFLVCKWYGEGNTVSELADLLNRSESNIEKALREGGVVLNE